MLIKELTFEILCDIGKAVTHNGCQLLAASIDQDRCRITVLAKKPYENETQRGIGELITWKYNPASPTPDLYDGHYHYEVAGGNYHGFPSAYALAMEDFKARSAGSEG